MPIGSLSRVVEATGLEPAASWSQTKHSTKLSYASEISFRDSFYIISKQIPVVNVKHFSILYICTKFKHIQFVAKCKEEHLSSSFKSSYFLEVSSHILSSVLYILCNVACSVLGVVDDPLPYQQRPQRDPLQPNHRLSQNQCSRLYRTDRDNHKYHHHNQAVNPCPLKALQQHNQQQQQRLLREYQLKSYSFLFLFSSQVRCCYRTACDQFR